MATERKCPACKKELEPANVVDNGDGSVDFACAKCNVPLVDNATRTALKVAGAKRKAKKAPA